MLSVEKVVYSYVFLMFVMIERDKLVRTLHTLKLFVNRSLCLDSVLVRLNGFHLNRELLEAAMTNAYVETVGDKADTLYADIKSVRFDQVTFSMLDVIRLLSGRFGWCSGSCVLAFDYTDEEFYGCVQGFYIHGWTGKDAITGKFKFLTCSMVMSSTGQRIPLLSVPIALGHQMSKEILYVLSLLKPLVGKIELILFDRGFYCKELIDGLTYAQINYLIFIPKNEQVKKELETMQKGENQIRLYEFDYQKDKNKQHSNTFQIFLKSVYSKRLDKELDWAFATNVEQIQIDSIIKTYMQRWMIETQFRIQDEANIKCKSTDMTIRYFFFVYEQLLQILWGCFYQQEVSFKKFLIDISKTCNNLVTNAPSTPPSTRETPRV